jgi:hypothetical protein
MPYNMKKAGIKYQPGGSVKSFMRKAAKSFDDELENMTGGLVNKVPLYKDAKKLAKHALKGPAAARAARGAGAAAAKMVKPNPANYKNMQNGGAMGYYADKAQYGREMARRKMMQEGGPYDSNIEALNVLEQEGDAMRARKQKRLDSKLKRKQTREKISSVNADIARNRSDKRAANQSNRRFGRR